MKIAICLIIKNENVYIKEWLDHHRNMGFTHFFIYDNMSNTPPIENEPDCTYIKWEDCNHASQLRAYIDCATKHSDMDYIAFIDTDEFIILKEGNIQTYIKSLIDKHGKLDGLLLSWRMYGSIPYFTEKQPITNYTQYHEHPHTKSIINPKLLLGFPDPHMPFIKGMLINESGKMIPYIADPHKRFIVNPHTSKDIWIKHTWTRSLNEFKEKLERGSGDYVKHGYTLESFYSYNNQCLLSD